MTKDIFRALAACALLLSAAPAWGIGGRVETASGTPVERAQVEAYQPGQDRPYAAAVTDGQGRFELPDVEPPVLLSVRHPRFEEAALTVTTDQPVVLSLTPKQAVYEEIVVSATRGGDSLAPAPLASTVVRPEEMIVPPATLLEMVDDVPGVAENGQAGIFQVFSIRGVSRHRVLTLLSGMQLTSERRAGVSASFVDPLLMGSVDLLRGPASSYYGSGALGGVVQVFPETFDALTVRGGWETPSDERYVMSGWGEGGPDGLSLALAHREAESTEAADGSEIFSPFEQTSATLRKRWDDDLWAAEVLAIPTIGRDIGKANVEFPERTTVYPEENHLLVKGSLSRGERWHGFLYAHPHELETETTREDGRVDTVFNETVDLGLNSQWELPLGDTLSGRFGVDWFGRRDVTAIEEEIRPGEPVVSLSTLDGARHDEVAAYGSARKTWGRATVEAGGRFTWLSQDNAGEGSLTDSAWTGFAGAVMPLGGGFELSANVGTGLRFPNLSERFFTGTTGRGEILANRDLSPESAFNTDLRLAWFGSKLFVEADVFRNAIDDYIERIELTDGVLTFVNLTSGTLRGFEFEGFYQMRPTLRLSWGGHTIEGEDDAGRPLADVPPDRVFLALRRVALESPWSWAVRLEQRGDKDDPGSGELPLDAATLLSATVSYDLPQGLALSLSAGNLLDEAYRSAADDLAPLAEGRSFGLGVAWRR